MRAVLIGAVESTRIALRCLAEAPEWDLAGVVTLPLALADRHSDFVTLSPMRRRPGAIYSASPTPMRTKHSMRWRRWPRTICS